MRYSSILGKYRSRVKATLPDFSADAQNVMGEKNVP